MSKRNDLMGSAMAVRLDKPTNNPILVGVQKNEYMGCWEITVTIGNFGSESSARQAATELVVPALEKSVGMKAARFTAAPGEGSA